MAINIPAVVAENLQCMIFYRVLILTTQASAAFNRCSFLPIKRSFHFKADSHIPYRSHAVPLPCRSAKALDCVFPIWFTQCGRVWFTRPMPFPCHATNMPFWKRLLKAMAGWQHETACWRLASFRPLAATARSSRKFVIISLPISDAGGQCETKQRLWWSRRSLLFWCKDMSACVIYSTKIMITI
jgi:hypothetical protein